MECGNAIAELVNQHDVTLLSVQHSLLYDIWLCSNGDLLGSWQHGATTMRLARSIGLHLEPEIPASNKIEDLLQTLWGNEERKRVWLNVFVWDVEMAMVFGRPAYTNMQIDAPLIPPVDCMIPQDRLHRVPTSKMDSDGPTPMTERVLRYQLSLRVKEVRELEAQDSVPQDPEKVKELHRFAVGFRDALPPFFRNNSDSSWDAERPYITFHREMLSYSIESFLIALHRPYATKREKSQRQIVSSALAILDSQDRLETFFASHDRLKLDISIVFPTFDAAMILVAILVLNPRHYHSCYWRSYASLSRACSRLKSVHPTLTLAQYGARLLEIALQRSLEAHQASGGPFLLETDPQGQSIEPQVGSELSTPSEGQWLFETSADLTDRMVRNSELHLDSSSMQMPLPTKELMFDKARFAAHGIGMGVWPTRLQGDCNSDAFVGHQLNFHAGNNAIWNLLTEGSRCDHASSPTQ